MDWILEAKRALHHGSATGCLRRQGLFAKSPLFGHLPAPGLVTDGNLEGAEHAVENNLGGRIFFLLGSVKSLIYGSHSDPGL